MDSLESDGFVEADLKSAWQRSAEYKSAATRDIS